MSTWSKILGGLLVLIAAAVVSMGLMLKNVDTAQFKAPLERMVERATGRDFILGGDLDLVLSLNPKLSVTNVQLANAPWGTQANMMKLQRLDAEIDVLALLSRRLDVTYIILDGVELYLETDGKGLANWEFTPQTEQAASGQAQAKQKLALNPNVQDVHLQNVKVHYLDGATGLSLEAELSHANFTADSLDSQMKGILEATVNGVEMQASAEMGSFAHIVGTEGGDFPLNLKISGPDITADLVAMVKHPGRGVYIDARVDAEISNEGVLGKLIGVNLPPVSPIVVRSKIDVAGTRITLNGLDAELGDNDVQGIVSIQLGKIRPKVIADLRSQTLNVNTLAGLSSSTNSSSLKSPVFSNTQISLDGLGVVDAELVLEADKIRYDDMVFTDVKTKASLADKTLTIKPLSFEFQRGRINAQAHVNGAGQQPDYSLRGTVRGLNATALAALTGQRELVDLNLDGDVLFISKGQSLQDLAKGARGHVNLIGRDGR
ncbi:MAG: AsmA family protein, partial [Magnetovibrio sp.]|nr:AsmA family protein [Magnetovibrio sp.]